MKKNDAIELSFVMPCLNEAETLEVCINKAQASIDKENIKAEIIIADNGSNDGSQFIAEKNGATVVHVSEKGYGAALMGGITVARGKFVIMGDADDSYDFSDIGCFIKKLRQGYDLVMGCRLPAGGGSIMPGAMPIKHRILGNPVLSFIGRLFFISPITDFHCGLRAFTKEAFEKLDLHTTGMEFASEMVIKATLMKIKMTEIPITLYKDGRSRPPHLRSWKDGWRHLRFMLMYCPRWLFLAPGSLLFFFGLIASIVLIQGPVRIGQLSFDTNTLLVSAMSLLIGFQLIAFYFFTKTFAITEGFLPEDRTLNQFFSVIKLETGIIIGGAAVIIGFVLILTTFFSWSTKEFGDLSYPESLRQVIPAVTMMLLGVQIVFSSFFMSILGMGRK